MAENKKSFLLYTDQMSLFEQLPDDVAGQLIKHVFKYVNDMNPETDNLLLKIAFEPIKLQLKRDLKTWEDIRETRSAAGKKGMENRWKTKHNYDNLVITNDNSVIADITKITVNDNVNVNDNVTIKENIKEKPKKVFCIPTFQEISDYCKERNNDVDANKFLDFYTAKGWMIGKEKMKDWRACVRTWEKPKYKDKVVSYNIFGGG